MRSLLALITLFPRRKHCSMQSFAKSALPMTSTTISISSSLMMSLKSVVSRMESGRPSIFSYLFKSRIRIRLILIFVSSCSSISGPFIANKSTTPFPTVPQPNRAIETLFMDLPPLFYLRLSDNIYLADTGQFFQRFHQVFDRYGHILRFNGQADRCHALQGNALIDGQDTAIVGSNRVENLG